MTQFDLPDPRGIADQLPADPAARPARLDGLRLVLVDNGKLSPLYGSLHAIADALFGLFGTSNWTTYSRDLLRYHQTQLAGLTEEIVALSPDAVIFALADAGVSVQTTLIAVAVEKHGIPTAILASALGHPACKAIAQSRVPALPVVQIDIVRSDSPEKIQSLLAAARAEIETALTRLPKAATAKQSASGAMTFIPKRDGLMVPHEFQDWLAGHELGDGLPLLPPVPEVVDALLATVPFDPDEIIYESALTSGRSLRVRDAAANAAMTGCPTKSFPVVVAALRAVALPDFRLAQAAITTHPSGYCVILSGCDPGRFGLSGGPGCLGPGHRGNLSVGRAVSLTIQHLFGARPGGADLTILGSPAEIAYCMGEQIGDVPWPMLAKERGFEGPAVLVVKAEGPRNVLEHLTVTPVGICEALAGAATSLCSNNSFVPGDLIVIVNPEHARIFTDAGWSRTDLAQALHHRACISRKAIEGRGALPIRPAYMDALEELPVTRSPADIHIVVGGAPGPQSFVALPWGFSRGQWTAVTAR